MAPKALVDFLWAIPYTYSIVLYISDPVGF